MDTIIPENSIEKNEINAVDEFIIPQQMADKPIDFQVNSEISYLNFSHFVKNESKKLFYQALLKEKEVNLLSVKTDSLRKNYANSSFDQKEEISAQILKAEDRSITLNEEIPIVYEKARELEKMYWQSVPASEIAKFQEKIRLYKDSVQQIAGMARKQTNTINPTNLDTIVFYQSPQNEDVKTEVSTGIIYKIQVGAFKGKVPDTALKSIKKLSLIRKVENFTDEKGVKTYTTGSLKKYQEAVIMQGQVKHEGIKNAAITAYQNGKKISVDEARKLNKEL